MISIHKGAPVNCIHSESTRAAALISDVTEGVGRFQGLLFLSLQKANKKKTTSGYRREPSLEKQTHLASAQRLNGGRRARSRCAGLFFLFFHFFQVCVLSRLNGIQFSSQSAFLSRLRCEFGPLAATHQHASAYLAVCLIICTKGKICTKQQAVSPK